MRVLQFRVKLYIKSFIIICMSCLIYCPRVYVKTSLKTYLYWMINPCKIKLFWLWLCHYHTDWDTTPSWVPLVIITHIEAEYLPMCSVFTLLCTSNGWNYVLIKSLCLVLLTSPVPHPHDLLLNIHINGMHKQTETFSLMLAINITLNIVNLSRF